MQCNVASLDQMGETVGNLMNYAKSTVQISEVNAYYLKVVLSELIINCFVNSPSKPNSVKIAVDISTDNIAISVKSSNSINKTQIANPRIEDKTEYNCRLAIVKGLCQSIERNLSGDLIKAKMALI